MKKKKIDLGFYVKETIININMVKVKNLWIIYITTTQFMKINQFHKIKRIKYSYFW